LIPKGLNGNGISRKKVTLAIFIVISSAQILTSGWATREFKNHFLQISKENNEAINAQLKRDIEFLLGLGLRIDRLVELDAYLGEIIRTSPEIKDINLFHHSDQPLYRATKEKTTDFQRSKDAYQEWVEATKPPTDIEYNHKNNIMSGGDFKGYVSTNASKDALVNKLIDIGMDFLAVIVISMLFFVEMLILIFKYFERRVDSADRPPVTVHYGLMRPAAFLLLFGIDISVSFLPLHMETLYTPLFGLSKDTVMGLPISVEFLFVGISILIAGVWLDRRGWHEPFLCGLYLACAGLVYSWLAPDALNFIISRGIVGFGYGLSLMASQGFVIRYSDWKSKAQGLAHLFAGIYAGSICGAATGGMLAEWFGYHSVFLIGAFIVFSVFIYSIIFMRSGMRRPVPQVPVQSAPSPKGKHFLAFLSNRTILGLIFLSSLPAAIAVIGFLNYFSPIYLNRIGASQSTIGQILMIYGICLIYFGPFISRYVDASQHKRTYIFIGCTLGSLSLLTFHILGGLSAAIVAILLLGLSSSLVLASQSAYALQLKVTQQLGEGKAIGIFRSSSRVGQMLGPLVFSAVIMATGPQQGLTYLGMGYLVTALLFLLFTQKETEETIFQYAESVEVTG
jgi:predicted MFS family arabinose efflux permease